MVKFTETAPFVAVEYQYEVEKILYKGKSKYQEIMVFENPYFGKILTLDGIVQLTERDEFFYHEMLAHVALHAHPDPKRVAVIGGGDGGTVREVCKHRSVEKVYFIEIDPEVIRISREFFPAVSASVGDSRVEIRNMDGAEFVKSRSSDIDVLLVDSTDPIGFARTLFSDEFFSSVRNALTEEGFFATHSESLLLHADMVKEVQHSLGRIFPVVDLYTAPIATYPGNWWAFDIGSEKLDPKTARREFAIKTKYYDSEIHEHAFLPRKLYERLLQGELSW
jgi:spermidine synthase